MPFKDFCANQEQRIVRLVRLHIAKLSSIMVKSLFQISALFFCSFGMLFGQKTVIDWTNVREGESVEYCITHKKMNELYKNPEFQKSRDKQEAELQQILASKESIPKGQIYTIPVVFHVLHNNGPENISDEQIYDAMEILNQDFRLQNSDANFVQSEFQGMPTDAEIAFVLAKKAPNGACFKGITRTVSTLTNYGNGSNQLTAVRNGNDVYQGNWPGNKYLNVFVCADVGGAAGYTFNPSTQSATSMGNGIWILHDFVGSIGTGSSQSSRALTHEVGHWLDLSHTWGSSNDPGLASNCSSDDGVSDTPNCIGVTACSLNANTCIDPSNDKKDNVENYMDYSYCSKMFTQGQVDRMRASLQLTATGRFNVWQQSNLTAVGAFDPPSLCKAEFTSNKTDICVGDSIAFSDGSFSLVDGWSWTFAGGTPSTSKEQNPVITYTVPGIYSVTLNASYEADTDTETKTGYVRVLPSSATLPFFEGFESYSSLSNMQNWQVYNGSTNNTFVLDNNIGHTGSKCVKLINFGQSGSNIDELIASPVDLSQVASNGNAVTLSFRYAYRKRISANQEKLIVFITNNCGGSWLQRKTISGSALSSLTSSTSWAPASQSDWTTVHLTNILSSSIESSNYWVDNFRYKFRFEGNGGNNVYIDDINIYYGAPSDNIVLGLSEIDEIGNLNLYPNPSEDEINLHFSVKEPQKTLVEISDLSGKQIEIHSINAAAGSNLVMFDTHTFAAGAYLMTITSQGSRKVLPFTVK